MKNIIVLGANGKIGKAFLINNKNNYHLYSDIDNTIENLLSISFLVKNDIDLIKFLGSTNNKSLFFILIPISIATSLNKFSLISEKNYFYSFIIN